MTLKELIKPDHEFIIKVYSNWFVITIIKIKFINFQ